MEQGEGSATPPVTDEPVSEKKKVKIRCDVFFDGTLNNRTNIAQRLIAVSAEGCEKQDDRR